ncbi:MAG: GNAT family N-acetyltransferase [Gemmatimonadetes bacterium]|nr:GNAT family N-acetyltransferase [Gemmatimonadota bacterium]
MRECHIRRARAGDLDGLLPLFADYLAFYHRTATSLRIHRFLSARLAEHPVLIWVAEGTGESARTLSGFVQVYPTYSSLGLGRAWTLNDLFVCEEARGTGVGRALVETVLVHAQRRGVVSVDLMTQRSNEKAQRLYLSLGFQPSTDFLSYSTDPTTPVPTVRGALNHGAHR